MPISISRTTLGTMLIIYSAIAHPGDFLLLQQCVQVRQMLIGNDRRFDTPHPATDHPIEHPGGNLQRSTWVIGVQTATPDLDAALIDDGNDVNELTMPGVPRIEHFAW
jgi:hypothetical protein